MKELRYTSVLVVLLVARVCLSVAMDNGEEKLIGWKGDTYNPEEWDPLHPEQPDDIPLPAAKAWVEQISWKPRAYIYHNFISDQEAIHLVKLAAPQMKRSTVVGAGGKSVEDSYRTSYGTFLQRYQDKVVQRLENRVAAWTHIPVVHQEDTQILRYSDGQKYGVHYDSLPDEVAGPRVATILIYLNAPEEGGETAFPTQSEWVDSSLPEKFGPFSKCADGHVAFKPKRGDALLFWSIKPDGTSEDIHSAHAGCPVTKGVKWTATKWVHARPFRPESFTPNRLGLHFQPPDAGRCVDRNTECANWAAKGECEKNHDFMIVGATDLGVCRKSCGVCEECQSGDKACEDRNRAKVGFLVFNESELNV